jgi:outer membrane protein TolC
VEKAAAIEVRSAIIECVAADSNEIAMREMFAAANEGYQLTKIDFELGSGKLVDVQQAEERLQQAEMGIASARQRKIHSRAALLVCTGRYIVKMEDSNE